MKYMVFSKEGSILSPFICPSHPKQYAHATLVYTEKKIKAAHIVNSW